MTHGARQLSLGDEFSPTEFGGDEDFYETPPEATRLVLPYLPQRPWARIVEPCAGRGAIVRELRVSGLKTPCSAVELTEGRCNELPAVLTTLGDSWLHADFLTCAGFDIGVKRQLATLWITNPPYSKPRETIGMEILEHALTLTGPLDCVAFLMPTDFCTGVARVERIHERWACSFYPLKRRPTFSGDGDTAKRPFAWFVFDLLEPKRQWMPLG